MFFVSAQRQGPALQSQTGVLDWLRAGVKPADQAETPVRARQAKSTGRVAADERQSPGSSILLAFTGS